MWAQCRLLVRLWKVRGWIIWCYLGYYPHMAQAGPGPHGPGFVCHLLVTLHSFSPSVTLSVLSSLGQKSVCAVCNQDGFFKAFLMHLVSGLKIPCPRFHCFWHKLMDFQIKICQYILASRRSKNLRQIKNLCNKYLADHSKQVLTPPLNSLINRNKSWYLWSGRTLKLNVYNEKYYKIYCVWWTLSCV